MPEAKQQLKLRITRTFAAPLERAYAAWTEQAELEKWMCRDHPTHATRYLELEVRPGGNFTLEIRTRDGDLYRQHEKFVEIVPRQRLVFTWWYEKLQAHGKAMNFRAPETLVTVDFRAVDQGTEITLTHEGFTSREEYEGTVKGWNGCFDMLERALRK